MKREKVFSRLFGGIQGPRGTLPNLVTQVCNFLNAYRMGIVGQMSIILEGLKILE